MRRFYSYRKKLEDYVWRAVAKGACLQEEHSMGGISFVSELCAWSPQRMNDSALMQSDGREGCWCHRRATAAVWGLSCSPDANRLEFCARVIRTADQGVTSSAQFLESSVIGRRHSKREEALFSRIVRIAACQWQPGLIWRKALILQK